MEQAPPPQYAEYQRGPIEPRIRFETISEAWRFFSAQMGVWVLATFIMLFATVLFAAPIYVLAVMQMIGNRNPSMGDMVAFYGYAFLAGILAYVGQTLGYAGMYNIALKQIQGELVSIRDMFSIGGGVLNHIIAGLVISVGVMIGSLACYLPAFIIGGLLLFVQPIIVHQKVGAIAAISQSWNLLKGQIWMAAAFYLVITLVASLGAIACGIGMLFTYPLYPIAVSLVYRDYLNALYPPKVG